MDSHPPNKRLLRSVFGLPCKIECEREREIERERERKREREIEERQMKSG